MSGSAQTQFVLDALEQAVWSRRPGEKLVHHIDRGSQYVSIRYTDRLLDGGIEPLMGSVGDSYRRPAPVSSSVAQCSPASYDGLLWVERRRSVIRLCLATAVRLWLAGSARLPLVSSYARFGGSTC